MENTLKQKLAAGAGILAHMLKISCFKHVVVNFLRFHI